MNSKLDESQINQLPSMGIHVLRTLARNCGVKSPTTMKKEELIEEIIKINNGEIEPVTNRLGRKPRQFQDFAFESNNSMHFSDELEFNMPQAKYNSESIIIDGQIKFINNSAPVVRIKEQSGRIINIPITPAKLYEHNLKKDDVLTLELMTTNDSYYGYKIEKILSVNGIELDSYNSDKFYDLPKVINTYDQLNINYSKYRNILSVDSIFKGSSNFFYFQDSVNIETFAYNFASEIKDKNTNVVILNGKAFNCILSEKDNIEIHNLDVDKAFDELGKEIILVQEKVKNLVTQGKKVVFIITELDEIFKIINYNTFGTVSDEISPDTITAIRRLIHIARYINEEQNLTVLIFSSLSIDEKYRNVIINDVLKYPVISHLPNDFK